MHKPTPGPWFINETLGHAVCVVARVRIAADKLPDSNTDADARLIAAAPDLLEFAEEVRRTGDTRLASMALAVIAKATGGAA